MSGLSPQSRSIIEAARHGEDPSPSDRARIRRSLALRFGAGVAAGGVAASASSAAGAAGAAAGVGGVLGKVIIGAVLLALGGTGYYAASRPVPEQPPVVVALAASIEAAAPASTMAAADSASSPPVREVSGADAGVASPPGQVIPETLAADPSAVSSSDLEREVAQLREAHEALRDGKPAEAMNVLEEGHEDVLAEERAAMRVFTLCRMGKAEEARAEAARFLATWPKSPQAARVRTACAAR